MKEFIRAQLYEVSVIAWAKRNKESGYIETRQVVVNDQGDRQEFLEPKSDAMLLMAKYYELKYGVKIIVVTKTQDLDSIKGLIEKSEKSSAPVKFGFVLPNFLVKNDGSIADTNWNANQNFYELEDKLIYNEGHVCPVVYEKLPDGRSSIIVIDSIGGKSPGSVGHSRIIDKMSDSKIPVYFNSAELQRSNRGCRDLAILMLKDALRMPNIVDELGFIVDARRSGGCYYDILPEALLKYLQTGSPWKTADSERKVLRSSPQKISQSLKEYSDKNLDEVLLGNRERFLAVFNAVSIDSLPIESSQENTKLLKENAKMMDRIIKLCEFYKISPNESDLRNFIKKVHEDQMRLPVELPSSPPEWSRAKDWQEASNLDESHGPQNSLSGYSREDMYNYHLFSFVAKNLNSQFQPKQKRAQAIFDPFLDNLGLLCYELIEDYLRDISSKISNMFGSMSDDSERRKKFISDFNKELNAELTIDDFGNERYKLKQALRVLNFNQESDPVLEIIKRCGVADVNSDEFENLKNILSNKNNAQKFIRRVNVMFENEEEYLSIDDLKTAEGLKSVVHKKLGCDSVSELLKKYNLYSFGGEVDHSKVYERDSKVNKLGIIDHDLYQKIVQNKGSDLSLKEAESLVDILKINNPDQWLNAEGRRESFVCNVMIINNLGPRYKKGLVELPKRELESCSEIANKLGNEAVLKMFDKDEKLKSLEELLARFPEKSPKVVSVSGKECQDKNTLREVPSM